MQNKLLDGKVAVITGGAGGIGLAVATAFSENGASIVLTDVDQEKLQKSAKSISGPVLPIKLDVTNENETRSVLEQTLKAFGKVDIVVPNAGILHLGHFINTEINILSSVLETNLIGAFTTAKIFTEQLVKQNTGGRVIFTSSLFGLRGGQENTAYSASKFGMIGMMQCLAAELASHNILTNCVCPGQMQTEMIEKLFIERAEITGKSVTEVRSDLTSKIPIGHLGSMSDLAGTYVYLASNLSNYVTGQSIVVDGGWQVG